MKMKPRKIFITRDEDVVCIWANEPRFGTTYTEKRTFYSENGMDLLQVLDYREFQLIYGFTMDEFDMFICRSSFKLKTNTIKILSQFTFKD